MRPSGPAAIARGSAAGSMAQRRRVLTGHDAHDAARHGRPHRAVGAGGQRGHRGAGRVLGGVVELRSPWRPARTTPSRADPRPARRARRPRSGRSARRTVVRRPSRPPSANHSAPSGPATIERGSASPGSVRVSSPGGSVVKRVMPSGWPGPPSTVIHSAPSGPPASEVGRPCASENAETGYPSRSRANVSGPPDSRNHSGAAAAHHAGRVPVGRKAGEPARARVDDRARGRDPRDPPRVRPQRSPHRTVRAGDDRVGLVDEPGDRFHPSLGPGRGGQRREQAGERQEDSEAAHGKFPGKDGIRRPSPKGHSGRMSGGRR